MLISPVTRNRVVEYPASENPLPKFAPKVRTAAAHHSSEENVDISNEALAQSLRQQGFSDIQIAKRLISRG